MEAASRFSVGEDVFYSLGANEPTKEGVVAKMAGENVTIKIEGGSKVNVNVQQVAPNLSRREESYYTNANGKQVKVRVLSIDISMFPPSYTVKEERGPEKSTEPTRLMSAATHTRLAKEREDRLAKEKADAMMAALVAEEAQAEQKQKRAKEKSKQSEAKQKAKQLEQQQKAEQERARAAAEAAAEEAERSRQQEAEREANAARERLLLQEQRAEQERQAVMKAEREARAKAKKAEKKAEKKKAMMALEEEAAREEQRKKKELDEKKEKELIEEMKKAKVASQQQSVEVSKQLNGSGQRPANGTAENMNGHHHRGAEVMNGGGKVQEKAGMQEATKVLQQQQQQQQQVPKVQAPKAQAPPPPPRVQEPEVAVQVEVTPHCRVQEPPVVPHPASAHHSLAPPTMKPHSVPKPSVSKPPPGFGNLPTGPTAVRDAPPAGSGNQVKAPPKHSSDNGRQARADVDAERADVASGPNPLRSQPPNLSGPVAGKIPPAPAGMNGSSRPVPAADAQAASTSQPPSNPKRKDPDLAKSKPHSERVKSTTEASKPASGPGMVTRPQVGDQNLTQPTRSVSDAHPASSTPGQCEGTEAPAAAGTAKKVVKKAKEEEEEKGNSEFLSGEGQRVGSGESREEVLRRREEKKAAKKAEAAAKRAQEAQELLSLGMDKDTARALQSSQSLARAPDEPTQEQEQEVEEEQEEQEEVMEVNRAKGGKSASKKKAVSASKKKGGKTKKKVSHPKADESFDMELDQRQKGQKGPDFMIVAVLIAVIAACLGVVYMKAPVLVALLEKISS